MPIRLLLQRLRTGSGRRPQAGPAGRGISLADPSPGGSGRQRRRIPAALRGPRLLLLPGLLAPLIASPPALALEEVVIEIPLLRTTFTVRLDELQSPQALQQGRSDLAELDRASGGVAGRQLLEILQQPVPISVRQVANGSVGSPLLEQAMLVISSLGRVEGRPADLSGRTLKESLLRASTQGDPTLLSLMQAIPGQRVTLDLGRARQIINRMSAQRRQAAALLASAPAAGPASPRPDAAVAVSRRTLRLPVPHRDQPLELLLIEPLQGATGRLVLVSHGLWDNPSTFEGWGTLLASRGMTVVLPRHPGSDSSQQQAVLAGQAAPPGPQELALRPKDLSAVLDAAASGRLGLNQPVEAERAVVLGHSWGATTALQLAGVKPTDSSLRRRCNDVDDPDRNLSWTLQCSWLNGVQNAAIADPRVIAVAAVSPPVSLLFPRGSGRELSGRVLLVSGSRDWVVPPDPEAIAPMRWGRNLGNQLVLVEGGDHFNLRPGASADGGVLGPLLLAWSEAAFAAGPSVRPAPAAAPLLPPQGWGGTALPMADVTTLLPSP